MASKKVGVPTSNLPVKGEDSLKVSAPRLTRLERQARREASQSVRVATMGGGFGGYGGMGGTGNMGAGSITNAESQFYSAQLSTDFFELPQSERDKRELIRFWVRTHPIVGAAMDFHTDVPMSKLRLTLPDGKDPKRNQQIHRFYEKMCKRMKLFQGLHGITREYMIHSNVYIFCEDQDLESDIPDELTHKIEEEEVGTFDYAGRAISKKERLITPKPTEEQDRAIKSYVREKYQGWQRMQVLPPEQVKMEVFQYTDRVRMELLPSEKDRMVVLKAQDQADSEAQYIADGIPEQIRDNLLNGQPIRLSTTPYENFLCSSFCYHLTTRRAPYDDRGVSMIERVLRTLIYQDKLRQAQTSIASRAMTPKRVIWAEKMSEPDVADLRDQIDQALVDPDFSIITNFELHWDEIGSRDRLLDLTSEYEITNKLLYIGLRITEPMLTGETSYSGERVHLDVMNTMYLLYREALAEFVEESLFLPVAEKKGFWEEDEDGNVKFLYPKLQFTRLALRDNSELQDFMFNLYQKGSMPIEYLYELLNIDPETAHALLKKEFLTFKDVNMNEAIRAFMTKAGEKLVDGSDAFTKLMENMGLTSVNKEGDRFSKEGE